MARRYLVITAPVGVSCDENISARSRLFHAQCAVKLIVFVIVSKRVCSFKAETLRFC